MSREVAALYVDIERGPYASMPGVDCWGLERDATGYSGPRPVIAHPPCCHWSRLKHLCKQPERWREAALVAVRQVRAYGGVLEHPAGSGLWAAAGLPLPGEAADRFGGWTLSVEQCRWGHKAIKRTWFYFVGVPSSAVDVPPWQEPTHVVCTSKRGGVSEGRAPRLRSWETHLTPPALAVWLVALARRSGEPATQTSLFGPTP